MDSLIRFIGIIEIPIRKLANASGPKRQNRLAILYIYPDYLKAAKHLKKGDKIIVLTWLRGADRSVLEAHPENNMEEPIVGVFSTASSDRPNPIGMHQVEIVSINPTGRIKVSGMDTMDQTPILDIQTVAV